jgi:hypothetical protein
MFSQMATELSVVTPDSLHGDDMHKAGDNYVRKEC